MFRDLIFLDKISSWQGRGVLSILGPTGSGKTQAALQWVGRYLDCGPLKSGQSIAQSDATGAPSRKIPLLVSVDAVAIFRGLDIGSAKPLGAEREAYDWIGIDLFSPEKKVSLGDYVECVFPKIIQALQESRPVILVGGSHFYEQALVEGQGPGAASDANFLRGLEALTNEQLARRLYLIDARFQNLAHANDRYRLTRYLDLSERQQLSFEVLCEQRVGGLKNFFRKSELFGQTAPAAPKLDSGDVRPVDPEKFSQDLASGMTNLPDQNPLNDPAHSLPIFRVALGLETTREENEQRLFSRVQQMLARGWIREVQELLRSGLPKGAASLQSVGYREVVQFLEGEITERDLPERILTAHLQLVKKQKTWIRGLLKKL